MAFLGRETEAEQARVARLGQWIRARSPLAVASVPMGVLAVLDFFTMVLGIGLGLLAVVLGMLGLRDIRRHPDLLGRRLAMTGIALGLCGLVLSAAFYVLVIHSGTGR